LWRHVFNVVGTLARWQRAATSVSSALPTHRRPNDEKKKISRILLDNGVSMRSNVFLIRRPVPGAAPV
jgi:hypothetical protein